LQVVFNEEAEGHLIQILLEGRLFDLRIEVRAYEQIDYFFDFGASLLNDPDEIEQILDDMPLVGLIVFLKDG
jgi:hypothetical protein